MSDGTAPARERWGGRTGFIIAAISSAIGLGNIWRFPGVAYENGGGAFLVPYLVAFLTAGLPILFLDYAIGHRYQAAPPLAYRRIDRQLEPLGWWQVGICFVIAVYYAAVIAWALAYVFFSTTIAWGDNASAFFFGEYLKASEPGVSTTFVPLVVIPLLVVWAATVVTLALGLRKGLERVNRYALPLLLVVFAIIVVYALTLDGAIAGLNEFFQPSWAALSDPAVWIAAYGHIFFSFSIAFGIMLTYSSYLNRKADLTGSGIVVAFANCGFEILAGIGVFATLGFLAAQQGTTIADLDGISGTGLAFVTFPTLLAEMPGGAVIGVLFFVSLALAGFTSLLSIMQVVSGAIHDKTGWSSRTCSLVVGTSAGVLSVLLFGTMSGVHVLDVVDAFVNNVGVVASAIVMLFAIGVALRMLPALAGHLNAVSSLRVGTLWKTFALVLTPLILLVVLGRGVWEYITQGYGDYPAWFLGVFGWGMIGALAIAAFAFSFGTYRRHGVDDFEPEDVEALSHEVTAQRAALRRRRSEGGTQP